MSSSTSAYAYLPRVAQNLAVSARGLQIRRQRTGRDFVRYLAEYEALNLSPEKTMTRRTRLLDQALARALSAPAYSGLSQRTDALELFPLRTKRDHSDAPAAYRLETHEPVVHLATSGSTGTPLRYATTRSAISHQWAVWWRYRRWHGIDLDTWCGYFGGKSSCPSRERSVFWRVNRPGRQVMFSTHHLSASTVERYVEEMNRRRLPWLHGLPSTLGLLTTMMEEAGLRFGPWLRWITFGSENVSETTVADVERVHGVRASEHYGLGEAVANLSQCPRGRLHVDEDFSYVEFVPYENPARGEDQLFRLIGTGFVNKAQAFVRYDTGDLVSGLEDGCECGRPGRTVSRVDGRSASYATLPSGVRVGPVSHILRDIDGIAQGQLFVTSAGELVFHVVPNAGFDASVEAELRARVRRQASAPVSVAVEVRQTLLRGPNGKVPAVVQDDPPVDDAEKGPR